MTITGKVRDYTSVTDNTQKESVGTFSNETGSQYKKTLVNNRKQGNEDNKYVCIIYYNNY